MKEFFWPNEGDKDGDVVWALENDCLGRGGGD